MPNPFGDKRYIPTTFEIRCGCGRIHKVRTAQQIWKITCWTAGCNRSIKIVMGLGRNNYRVYLVEGTTEKRITPIAVMQ